MNARYRLALQAPVADAAYHPAGINHARPTQKNSAKPATLLVFEMYARQKNLTPLQVSTDRRCARCIAPKGVWRSLRKRSRAVNSMLHGIVWVRNTSLFFKAFQNGCPNRNEEKRRSICGGPKI